MVNRYLRAISANYLFLAVNTVFFLIITPVAIRLMGSEFYGLWAILTAILLFSSSVGTLGMGLVVNKFGAEEGEGALKPDAIITSAAVILLPMAALIAGMLVILRHWIAQHLVAAPALQLQLSAAIVVVAASLFPQFLSRIPQGYLFSQLRYDLAQLIDTAANIALWIGAVLIAWRTHNIVWMAMWGLAIQVIALCVYLMLMARRGVLHWRWEPLALRRMGRFSFFTFLQSLAISLYQNLDRIVVGFILGPAAAGVYSVGTSVGLRLSIVTGQITDVMVPYASLKASIQQQGRILGVFRSVSRLVNLLLMLLGTVLILWMDIVLKYWISSDFANSYAAVFRILILAYMLLSASRPGHQTLMGLGQVRLASLIYLGTALVMLISLFYAASSWGLAGAAAANLLAVLLLAYNILALRVLGEPVNIIDALMNLIGLMAVPVAMFFLVVNRDLDALVRLLITCLIVLATLAFIWKDAQLREQLRNLKGALASREREKHA